MNFRAWVLLISLFQGCFVFSQNIQFRSNLHYTGMLSNIWAYHDAVNNREYALVGVQTGLSIVDVTNPDLPMEVVFVNGDTSLWQEPKTWGHYAYVTNETGHKGLMVVNLAGLPNSVTTVFLKGDSLVNIATSHTCFVDEKGILYLNGSKAFKRGSLFFDLNPDPMNPAYLGKYDELYVHDCFVRGDTLWAAEIYDGSITVVDVADKANPLPMTRFQTPFSFAHNCWLSKDAKTLFTTDERSFATVASYDVSNLENINLLDEYRHSANDSLVPHNTYIRPDSFLISSYYRTGVTIVDAHRPDNLVEVGHYDTSPFSDDKGFEGCWGVYAFLPSGNLICSDRQEGLFVLTPAYIRACYLEGKVTSTNGQNIAGARVEIMGTNTIKATNLLGLYKSGIGESGLYDIRIIDPSGRCFSKIISGVKLQHDSTTTLNVDLNCAVIAGVNTIEDSGSYSVYPSFLSSNQQLNIRIKDTDKSVLFTLSDLAGKTIKQFELNTLTTSIDLNGSIVPGNYIVQLSHSNGKVYVQQVSVR
jgi:choice-of-anchor B domain-containing protein